MPVFPSIAGSQVGIVRVILFNLAIVFEEIRWNYVGVGPGLASRPKNHAQEIHYSSFKPLKPSALFSAVFDFIKAHIFQVIVRRVFTHK